MPVLALAWWIVRKNPVEPPILEIARFVGYAKENQIQQLRRYVKTCLSTVPSRALPPHAKWFPPAFIVEVSPELARQKPRLRKTRRSRNKMMRWIVLACIAVAGVTSVTSAAEGQPAPTEAQGAPPKMDEPTECMPGMKLTGEKDKLMHPPGMPKEQFYGGGVTTQYTYTYRYRFMYPYYGGIRYGWRYPLSYWNLYGRNIYGDGCSFDRAVGDYYYC